MKKAYDSVNRVKLVEMLTKRAKSPQEHHIVQLIHELLIDTKMMLGDEEIKVNKGVPQGGVLSPLLFNVYLQEILETEPTLKKAIDEGKLIAFADDIMVMTDSKEETETALEALERLAESGLMLNKKKTQLLSITKDLEGIDEIRGVKLTKTVKYLGLEIGNDRDNLVKRVKGQCNKHMNAVRGKI